MSLIVKLKQKGIKNKRIYEIVVTHKKRKRNCFHLEKLGTYIPFKIKDKKILRLDFDKTKLWLNKGITFNKNSKKIIHKILILKNEKI